MRQWPALAGPSLPHPVSTPTWGSPGVDHRRPLVPYFAGPVPYFADPPFGNARVQSIASAGPIDMLQGLHMQGLSNRLHRPVQSTAPAGAIDMQGLRMQGPRMRALRMQGLQMPCLALAVIVLAVLELLPRIFGGSLVGRVWRHRRLRARPNP